MWELHSIFTVNVCSLQIGVGASGKYKIVLDSDAEEFGGHKLIDHSTDYFTSNEGYNNRPHSLMVRILCW